MHVKNFEILTIQYIVSGVSPRVNAWHVAFRIISCVACSHMSKAPGGGLVDVDVKSPSCRCVGIPKGGA